MRRWRGRRAVAGLVRRRLDRDRERRHRRRQPTTFLLGPPPAAGAWRKAHNEAAALRALLLGQPGLFRPRLAVGEGIGAAPSLYDLEPMRERLPELLDFDRLNNGETRLSIAATNVVSGERVVFDTARGGLRIGPE